VKEEKGKEIVLKSKEVERGGNKRQNKEKGKTDRER